MSQPSSYLATLERHRKTFAVMEEHQEAVEQLLELTRQSLKRGGKIIFLGNGGSAADSQHLAAEFMVRYKKRARAPGLHRPDHRHVHSDSTPERLRIRDRI